MSGLHFDWIRRGDPDGTPLLHVEGLRVRVGVRRIIDQLDFVVHAGDHVRITGPNGCGKSTLLNAIAGIEPARIDEGRIVFLGDDITYEPAHERARLGISYMRQTDNVFVNLTVEENLEVALGVGGFGRFAEAFSEWAENLNPEKRAGQLSGGEKKKLAWAMAVLAGKRLFLADEPEAGVAHHFRVPESIGSYVVVTHEDVVQRENSGELR